MKTTRLKIFSLLLALLTVLPLFAACRNAAETGKETTQEAPSSPQTTAKSTDGHTEWRDDGPIAAPQTVYPLLDEYDKMEDIALARLAASEGMVLLKNDNGALPLQKGATVAMFGAGQVDFIKGGTGSGDVNALYTVNLLDGMRNKDAEGKIILHKELADRYERSKNVNLSNQLLRDAVAAADNAIVVISRISGENSDLAPGQFNASAAETSLLRKVAGAGFKHVIVVLNIGAVMSTAFLDQVEGVDALLICWQPGLEGGNATADVLCGDVCPSGKLADTIAKNYADYPSSSNFTTAAYAEYTEDIFVGYRWFETFDPENKKVAFPFGFGLSYTTFDLSEPYVRENDKYIETQVQVTNTGKTAGKEVVQVYYSAPSGKLGAPGMALAGFAKTRLLSPGESQALKISFAIDDMAMYDDTGILQKSAYILEKGDYRVFVGNSLADAKARGAAFTHTESEDRVTLQLDGKIAPTTLTKRLTASGAYEELNADGYCTPIGSGKTVLSACDYLNQTGEPHIVANGSGSVFGLEMAAKKSLRYLVYAEKEGAYDLSFDVGMAGKITFKDALTVTLDGRDFPVSLTGTGGPFQRGQGGSVRLDLKKGANLISVKIGEACKSTFTLIALTFDGGGEGLCDLTAGYTPQELKAASDKVFDFKEVYDEPSRIDEFLDTLTPSEMISLLCGHQANVGRGDGSLAGLTDRSVPYFDLSDGPAGLDLAVKQVAWPIETCLACSFDTALLRAVGQKIGEECYKAGVDVWLAPGINIHRDPLGGRNFEYFSEDPLLTGKMASALTQGVQANGTAGVMVKHFYANSREAGRVDGNSSISERASRMIYMKAFEICVKESSPLSIMTTYNMANGMYTAENDALLDGVVRGEWGFAGFICTDWGSHSEQPRELRAGNDVKMGWGFPDVCLAAYKAGYLPLEDLRACARRILLTALHSGTMDRTLHPVIIEHTIAGDTRIKAAEMASRSPGVGLEQCEDEDGGVNPNYLQDGHEITYALNVTAPGTYRADFRVTSMNNNAAFRVFLDGVEVGAVRLVRATGGWQNWTTVGMSKKIDLPEGKHELKLVFGTAVNLNWIEFTASN